MGSKPHTGSSQEQGRNTGRKLKSNTKEQFGSLLLFLKTEGRTDVTVKGDDTKVPKRKISSKSSITLRPALKETQGKYITEMRCCCVPALLLCLLPCSGAKSVAWETSEQRRRWTKQQNLEQGGLTQEKNEFAPQKCAETPMQRAGSASLLSPRFKCAAAVTQSYLS